MSGKLSEIISQETANQFFKELAQLQANYGIYISVDTDYEFDYSYDGEMYESGSNSYLIFTDKDGNEVPEEYVYEDDME